MRSLLPRPRLSSFGPTHVVLAICALLIGLFLYSAIQSAAHGYRLQQQRADLELEVADLHHQVAELEGLKEYLDTDEYIEAVARQRFGLVLPGETAVRVTGAPVPTPTREPGERWWEVLFDR